MNTIDPKGNTMNTPTTPEQARHATQMLSECGDHHSAAIIAALAAQVESLTKERDAALFASRYETDLCGQSLADLKIITAERDGLAAAIRQTLEENGHLADGDV